MWGVWKTSDRRQCGAFRPVRRLPKKERKENVPDTCTARHRVNPARPPSTGLLGSHFSIRPAGTPNPGHSALPPHQQHPSSHSQSVWPQADCPDAAPVSQYPRSPAIRLENTHCPDTASISQFSRAKYGRRRTVLMQPRCRSIPHYFPLTRLLCSLSPPSLSAKNPLSPALRSSHSPAAFPKKQTGRPYS